MPVVQEHFPVIDCVIALDLEGRRIAFKRNPSHKPFIDILENLVVIWDKKCCKICEKEYDYGLWYDLKEGDDLFKYFKQLLIKDRQMRFGFNFGEM